MVPGDIVKIDTEEFYVVKHDGDDLVLLTHYNLKGGNNYDKYLTNLYGDYMKLPPIEKRITHQIKIYRIGE